MIKPTVGRVVWYHKSQSDDFPHQGPGQPLAAIVTCVWSDKCVNLIVFDANGFSHSKTTVLLVQPEDEMVIGAVPGSGYCEWMPYQQGQAAKAAELERKFEQVVPAPTLNTDVSDEA